MTAEVEICNLALSNIRAGSINSLTEASIQAQQCKLKYPIVRDMVLRDSAWQFSHKIAPLALLDAELFNWAYVYQYPSDCLYVNRVILNWSGVESGNSAISTRYYDRDLFGPNLDAQVEYQIYNIDGKKVIGCNDAEVRIDYRAKVTDTTLFDSTVIMAISHLLASELAIPLVGVDVGAPLREQELQLYTAYIRTAISHDMNEQYHEPIDSEFITGRF